MELVLDDLEDLLLVGRLLLPVNVITGGSTAAGGTYTRPREEWLLATYCMRHDVYSVCTDVTKVSYLSKLGKETVYFLLLARVEGLNLTHVPDGERGNEKYEEQAKERK